LFQDLSPPDPDDEAAFDPDAVRQAFLEDEEGPLPEDSDNDETAAEADMYHIFSDDEEEEVISDSDQDSDD
jgi:hypothetical protein